MRLSYKIFLDNGTESRGEESKEANWNELDGKGEGIMLTEDEIRQMIKILESWDIPGIFKEQARALRWALGDDDRSPEEQRQQEIDKIRAIFSGKLKGTGGESKAGERTRTDSDWNAVESRGSEWISEERERIRGARVNDRTDSQD